MALVRSLTVDGVEYPTAYSRIVVIRADKANAYVFVNTYVDEAARIQEDMPIQQEEPVTAISSLVGDLYVKAYDYLKTCPGFEAATDHPLVDVADVVPVTDVEAPVEDVLLPTDA